MTEKDLDIAIEKCERIMEFDTRTLENPESDSAWLFGRVYDLLKFLRRIQFETGAKDGDMDDTISRRALLDVVESVDWYHQNKNGEMVHGANSDDHQAWYKAEDIYKAIENVPPAQPGCEDVVPRTSVEYICRKNTVSTNPYEHKYHDKFIQFMDDPEISDFGRWQHSNGFNTALVAVRCDLDKVPSVTPKQPGWIPVTERPPEESEQQRTGYLATVTRDGWARPRVVYVEWETTTVRGKKVSRWIWNDKLFPEYWSLVAWIPLLAPYCPEGGQ